MAVPLLGSLCVFCGSSIGVDPRHVDQALALGRLMAQSGIRLVYGGGRIGLMGILAAAVLDGGGQVVGVIPRHLLAVAGTADGGVSDVVVVDDMHARKRAMFDRADAFCILPGGLGTLDEAFEILTWKQLGLHTKPVVIVNAADYWTPWLGLIDHTIGAGYSRPAVRDLFVVVESVDQIVAAVRRQPLGAIAHRSDLF